MAFYRTCLWKFVQIYMKLLPPAVKLPTDDRFVLEQIIFKEICVGGSYRDILFVGCSRYTSWYPWIFRVMSSVTFATVDPDPGMEAYGSSARHITAKFQDLASLTDARCAYDLVILNGVFEYGIDTPDEKADALRTAYHVLKPGGTLLIGYRDLEGKPDLDLSLIDRSRFRPADVPGLSCSHYGTKNENRHAFVCFDKVCAMVSQPLSPRFRSDGVAIIPLNEVQREYRDIVLSKIQRGEYELTEVSCPACNSQARRLLSEKDMYGLPMNVVQCLDCDFVFTGPRLSDMALKRFYENEYRKLDRGVVAPHEDFFRLQWKKGELIFAYLAEHALLDRCGKLVVEVGCGAGGILAYFREQGYEVLGCDLNREYLQYGVSKCGMDLRYGDLSLIKEILEQRGLPVGLIIYEQVLEHVPDLDHELRLLRLVMARDSLLYVGVPGLRNIDAHYGSDFLRYLQIPHLYHFDLASLARILSKYGFVQVVGDEVVRAVFEVVGVSGVRAMDANRSGDIWLFLLAMEKRREERVRMETATSWLQAMKNEVKGFITNSPLPQPVKGHVISLLRQASKLLPK